MARANPFPVDAPIRPEARQIGRGPAIDALEKQVVSTGQHTLLFAERRVGKTSMAWAVLDRVRAAESGWAIEANLSRGPITAAAHLADHLAEQARASRIRVDSKGRGFLRGMRKAAKVGGAPLIGVAGKLLDVSEVKDISELSVAIDQSLAPVEEGEPDLRAVLNAIQAAAMAEDRTVVAFLDEVQRLSTDWANEDDSLHTQEALAEVMEQPDGRVVLLLAGSSRSAIDQLFVEGQPLYHDGMTFEVQAISDDDWHHGLTARFAEVGLEVSRDRITQILEASGGHPQRTMRVCAHVHQLANGHVFEISDVLVNQAITSARNHPSWSD